MLKPITCTCSHLRIDHQGGLRNISRLRVHQCMIQDCKCSKYHTSVESLDASNARDREFLKSIAIVLAIAGLAFFGINGAIDTWFSGVTVLNTETGLATYNVTNTIGSIDPITYTITKSVKDELAGHMKVLVGIVLLVSLFAAIMGIGAKFERENRRWIQSRTDIDL